MKGKEKGYGSASFNGRSAGFRCFGSMGILPKMAFVLVHPKHKLADQNTRPFPTATFAAFSSLHLISCSIISPSSASWLIPGLNATATACLTALWHFGTLALSGESMRECQSVKVPKCHHNFFSYTPRRSFFRNGSSSPTSNMRKAVRRDMPMTSATARA